MLRNWMCFFHKLVIRKNICYCLLFDLSLLKILPLVILPLFEIMLYMVKTLKMGFFKKGWRDFFLFLDLRSTQTNTNNGQTSFPCTFFVSKPQSKIGVALASLFTIDRSFKMSYCMNFYLNWRWNYTWSKLDVCFLLSKYRCSSFDHV